MHNFLPANAHTSRDTAYVVQDYPYGFTLRTTLYVWLEQNKNGYRFITQTVNPKTGKENAPKKSTYSPLARLYLDDLGHIHHYSYTPGYSLESQTKAISDGFFDGLPDSENLQRFELRQFIIRTFQIWTIGDVTRDAPPNEPTPELLAEIRSKDTTIERLREILALLTEQRRVNTEALRASQSA